MRKIKILLLALVIASFFGVTAQASAYSEEIKEIYSVLDSDTRELLDELGINTADFDSIFSVTPQRVASLIKKLLTGSIEAPTRSAVGLIAVIILLAIFECFSPEDDRLKGIVGMIGALLCVACVISPLSTAISFAAASIELSEKLMLALIPVLAGVITVTGNPTLAASFQAIAFGGAQIISGLSDGYIVPIVGAVMALDP